MALEDFDRTKIEKAAKFIVECDTDGRNVQPGPGAIHKKIIVIIVIYSCCNYCNQLNYVNCCICLQMQKKMKSNEKNWMSPPL